MMRARIKESAIALANAFYNMSARKIPPLCRLPREPFRALNEYFDEIWVLTIGRNLERREHIKTQFEGMQFSYFEGIDGKTLTEEDARIDLKQAGVLSGRTIAINELACTMSHVVMFRSIAQRELKRVLIFEDDAVFVRNAGEWIPYCLERLPVNWDLLYLGYGDGELRGYLREFQERFGRRIDPLEVVSRSVGRGLRTAAGHDFTHAYAVTLPGAKKLLDDAYPIRYTADGWLEHKVLERKVVAYITIPKLFVQRADLGSSIHKAETPR
jgi:glycosyl transferase family 25